MNNNFEKNYNDSIKEIIKKFIESKNDYFLTEKDIHFHFFHYCLSKHTFEYNGRLLIHTEYPMPFKAKKTEDLSNPLEIIKDKDDGMRPHIDSVLINPKFIKWIIDNINDEDSIDDYIRGLTNKNFPDYINHFRDKYNEFNDNILSYSLEFKYLRSGYDGINEPLKNILYDLKKLELIGKKNKILNIPFSKKCTLLIFIGKRELIKKRGNIVEKLVSPENDYKELLKKFNRVEIGYSENKERCVIHYDLIN
ncbi:MAG: hypothetical protein ACFFCM_16375 [Promethearchaeota archaeon]